MLIVTCIEFLLKHEKAVRRIAYAVLALLVLVDAMPFLVNKDKAHTSIETLPGFWAAFGLLGCIFLIIASKKFGAIGIVKPEDYYHD